VTLALRVVKRSIALALAVSAVVAVAATMASGSRDTHAVSSEGVPTWTDVAPVFAEKCAGCHTPGGIAPFSLTTARSAARYARVILAMTQAGRMPPWMPGHDSPEYLGQSRRILTPAEKDLIARWVRGGARIGAGGSITAGGQGSNAPGTTMTLEPARSYLPKAAVGGVDDYHCFLLEPHLTQDMYVTSAVVQPQQGSIVHHVILFEATGQNAVDARRLNDQSGGNGWTCFGGPGLSETNPGANAASSDRLGAPPWISAWVPGHTTNDLPAGTGVLLHAGAAVVMQVHYNLIHPAKPDRSRAVLRVVPAKDSALTPLDTVLIPAPVELPCPRSVHSQLCSRDYAVQQEARKYGYNASLIPLGLLYLCHKSLGDYPRAPRSVSALTTTCDRRVNRPLRIYGVAGHMHLRGVDIRIDLNPGTPGARTVLHIPRWDFHWQDAYYLAQPLDANPGDTIRVSCRFDNSAKRQPVINGKRLKPRYVLWGEGTTDEMCLGLLQVANR
jgi:Copper type II ascorbate-dependent monooxygenase, C-terminal domain